MKGEGKRETERETENGRERERERDRKKGRSEERKKERKEVKERKEGKKGGRKENGSRDWQIICLCRLTILLNALHSGCFTAAAPISVDTLNYFASLDIPVYEVWHGQCDILCLSRPPPPSPLTYCSNSNRYSDSLSARDPTQSLIQVRREERDEKRKVIERGREREKENGIVKGIRRQRRGRQEREKGRD